MIPQQWKYSEERLECFETSPYIPKMAMMVGILVDLVRFTLLATAFPYLLRLSIQITIALLVCLIATWFSLIALCVVYLVTALVSIIVSYIAFTASFIVFVASFFILIIPALYYFATDDDPLYGVVPILILIVGSMYFIADAIPTFGALFFNDGPQH